MAVLDRHYRWARAYRDGQCVCRRADVVIGQDTRRVGLAPHERRRITVRFLEHIDPGLRDELVQLRARRGARAARLAEHVSPIEIQIQDPHIGTVKLVGQIEPPLFRHGDLRDIEFGVRETSG